MAPASGGCRWGKPQYLVVWPDSPVATPPMCGDLCSNRIGTGGSIMAIVSQRTGLGIRRHFTSPTVHPYDEIVWERRDARITNYRDGHVAFEQLGVEVP